MGLSLFFQQSIYAQVVSSTEQTTLIGSTLPTATQKIVAAVYPFRLSNDQSPQPANNASQRIGVTHYTEILLDILRTSGWFIPTEYSTTGDLLNGKRDKLSNPSTVIESVNSTSSKPTIIVEAGLFSHDETTIGLDEAGNAPFPNSVSNRYRRNRATVLLRVMSTQSGKILKTIYWTTTALSQLADGDTYRYILAGKSNPSLISTKSVSPDELVIVEALKQAVRGLIIESIRDGVWMASNVSNAQMQSIIAAYEAERNDVNQSKETITSTHKSRRIIPSMAPPFISLCLYGGLLRYHGDYVNWDTKGTYGLSVEAYATPYIGLHLNAASGVLSSHNAFSTHLTSISINLMLRVLPYWRLTPLVYGGIGMVSRTSENPFNFQASKYFQFQGGLGLQYSLNNTVGVRTMLTYNLPTTDMLDGKQLGSYNDFYVQKTLGLVIHFGQYVPGSNQKSGK